MKLNCWSRNLINWQTLSKNILSLPILTLHANMNDMAFAWKLTPPSVPMFLWSFIQSFTLDTLYDKSHKKKHKMFETFADPVSVNCNYITTIQLLSRLFSSFHKGWPIISKLYCSTYFHEKKWVLHIDKTVYWRVYQ